MAVQRNKFTANGQQVLREMEKMRKQSIKNREELKKLRMEAAKGNRDMRRGLQGNSRAMRGQINDARNMIKQYVGIQAAVSSVNKVLADKLELERRAAGINQSVARGDAAVTKNIGPVSKRELKNFLDSVALINSKTSFGDEGMLKIAASSALSASGGDQKKVLEALAVSAPFFRDKPSDLSAFTGSLIDFQKAAGGTMKENMALMLGLQGQARITEVGALKNFAPAAAAARSFTAGADRLQEQKLNAALLAAIGSISGDTEGPITASGVIAFQKKLEETFPKLDSLRDKLESLRNSSDDVKKEFLKSGFEKKVFAPIKELITDRKSPTSVAFEKSLASISTSKRDVDIIRSNLTGGSDELLLDTIQKTIKANEENRLKESSLAMLDTARSATIQVLKETRPNNPWAFTKPFAEMIDIRQIMMNSPEAQIAHFIEVLRGRSVEINNRLWESEQKKLEQQQAISDTLKQLLRLRKAEINKQNNRGFKPRQVETQ